MIKPSPLQVRSAVATIMLGASTLVGIAVHEGYFDTAYIPVKGDVPTIGFGTTKGVKLGQKTTPVRSLQVLLAEVDSVYAQGVRQCVTVPLHQHEFGAYVSLAYNVGVPTFCRKALPGESPNLIDLINAERYAEACERIDAFNKFGGKVLPGLVKRRAEERKICEGTENTS
ncbi:MAG: glycoside hydrolase family protein [Devosia sp.]